MPIIYSYPLITNPLAEDTFVLTRSNEDENKIETRSVTYENLRKRIIKDSAFVFEQGVAATTWNIAHGMGKHPSVVTVNNNNIEVKGQIQYTDNNNLTITFSAGFSGKAYLN